MTDVDAPLPLAIEALRDNRADIVSIVELLGRSDDPGERADLASSLVGTASRYEDVERRVVYPALRKFMADARELDRAEQQQGAVREALLELRRRTQHIKPDRAHADDPDGFEQAIGAAVRTVRDQLDQEDRELFPLIAGLDEDASEALRAEVVRAAANASSHPAPPRNALARAAVGVVEWLEREVHDESTSNHAGLARLAREHRPKDV